MPKYKIILTEGIVDDVSEELCIETVCEDLKNNKELLAKAIELGSGGYSDLEFYEKYGRIEVEKYEEPEFINIDV